MLPIKKKFLAAKERDMRAQFLTVNFLPKRDRLGCMFSLQVKKVKMQLTSL